MMKHFENMFCFVFFSPSYKDLKTHTKDEDHLRVGGHTVALWTSTGLDSEPTERDANKQARSYCDGQPPLRGSACQCVGCVM